MERVFLAKYEQNYAKAYLFFFFSTVNNAGLGLFGILETIPIEKAQQMFDVVFFGAIRTIKAVLPAMKLRGAGLILQNSSLFGLVGVPFSELYCAAKFALEGFIESLAPTLLNFNIRSSILN